VKRVIAAFRLLTPKCQKLGPLSISADNEVPVEGIGDFLDAVYIAVEKMRAFGFDDDLFGGPIRVVHREDGERANGRYFPEKDTSWIFFPQVRGVPDWVWTITHELSHRIWHKHLTSEAKHVWRTIAGCIGKPITAGEADALTRLVAKHPDRHNMWFFFSKHFGNDLSMFKAWLQTKRVSSEMPTDYANADPSESFAEVMTDTVLGRGHAGTPMKRSGGAMKKIILGLIAPLRAPHGFEEWLTEQQDSNFLQSQIDLPGIAANLNKWTDSNLAPAVVEKLERRPHVTLVYGLDKQDMDSINRVAQDYGRPIRLSPGAFNFFEAPEHDVLYIEAVGEGILQLRRQLLALPNTRPQTHADYIPHITVAYMKKGTAAKFKGNTPFKTVLSREGFSLIDAVGVESFVPTVSGIDASNPILLAAS
jgi:2'-5' RNA ligase